MSTIGIPVFACHLHPHASEAHAGIPYANWVSQQLNTAVYSLRPKPYPPSCQPIDQRPSLIDEGGLIDGHQSKPGEIQVLFYLRKTDSPSRPPGEAKRASGREHHFQSTPGANTMHTIQTETAAVYNTTQTDDAIISEALLILDKRMRQHGEAMSSPNAVKSYLRLKLSNLQHEVFCVLFLDSQNRVIEFEEMFRGSLSQASVYPREIVKAALSHNAASIILAHNHPSGAAEPSHADIVLTDTLKNALALIDIKVLDHFIVADTVMSFSERSMI